MSVRSLSLQKIKTNTQTSVVVWFYIESDMPMTFVF